MVGHLTGEYSRIAWYFLARGGSISVKASNHRWHSNQLCGRMEILCYVTFTCSGKATLNWLKVLLKVVIYANLRHGVQMFSQISRIPDLIWKYWVRKCGLYAGVYGKLLRPEIHGRFFVLTPHPLGISIPEGFVKTPLPSGISVFSLPSYQNSSEVPSRFIFGKWTIHRGTINSFYSGLCYVI